MGAGAAIAYLQGGGYEALAHTITNAVAILSGTICDGAKPSCAAKIASAVDAGILGYEMYCSGGNFHGGDGILGESLEELRVEHMPVSAVPAEYRPAALQTFARRYLAGEELPAAHREDCLKYIKSQRRRLWQDPWVLRVILREKYITAGEIAGYTGKLAQLNNPELTAALLEYRNQNFTQEQIDRAEEKKIEKTLRDMG